MGGSSGRMTIRFTKPPSRPILTIVQAVKNSGRKGVKAMAQKAYSLVHTKWMRRYHIVFTPKYRRKVIYNQIRKDIGEILRKLCEYKGVEIIEGRLMPDHVHMLVAIPPKYSMASVVGYLKGKSSLMIFDRLAAGQGQSGLNAVKAGVFRRAPAFQGLYPKGNHPLCGWL